MIMTDAEPCYLVEACDELILHAILCRLESAADLARISTTCKRLYQACKEPALWAHLCYKKFGLRLQGEHTCAAYRALRGHTAHGPSEPSSILLPFQGAITDTAVDLPVSEYWAHNLFSVTPRSIFSTAAAVRNAHAWGVLSPWTDHQGAAWAGASSSQAVDAGLMEGVAPSDHEETEAGPVLQRLKEGNLHRNFLVKRLQHVVEVLMPAPQQGPVHNKALATCAKVALEGCSTRGLEDLLLLSYTALVRREPLGRALLQGITHQMQLTGLRELALSIWNGEVGTGLAQEIVQLPGAGSRTSGGPLYERHAMLLALRHAHASLPREPRQEVTAERPYVPPVSLGVIEELLVSSHVLVTCPVKSGVLYACVVPPAVGAGHPGRPELEGVASDLLHLSSHAWVKVCDDMTDALQVLEASAQGQLPPVYNWFQCKQGEWVEFDVAHGDYVPGAGAEHAEALTNCQQRHMQAVMEGSQLSPAVWFRMYSKQESAEWMTLHQEELQSLVDPAPDTGAAAWGASSGAAAAAAVAAIDVSSAPVPAPASASGAAASASGAAAPGGAAAGTQEARVPARRSQPPCPALNWPQERQKVLCARQQKAAAALAAEGGEVPAIKPVVVLDPCMWEATTSQPGVCPNLSSTAPELSSLLGWGGAPVDEPDRRPSLADSDGQLHIRLHRPRPANCVLAKLIAAHDLRPEYNQQRGGCNIDAGHLGLKGRRLALPAGCIPAGGGRSGMSNLGSWGPGLV